MSLRFHCPICKQSLNKECEIRCAIEGGERIYSVWRCQKCANHHFNSWLDTWNKDDNEDRWKVISEENFDAAKAMYKLCVHADDKNITCKYKVWFMNFAKKIGLEKTGTKFTGTII